MAKHSVSAPKTVSPAAYAAPRIEENIRAWGTFVSELRGRTEAEPGIAATIFKRLGSAVVTAKYLFILGKATLMTPPDGAKLSEKFGPPECCV